MTREPILKTWKLFVGGAFPRTESGRTVIVRDARERVVAHCCRASRKDLRNAVESAPPEHAVPPLAFPGVTDSPRYTEP